MISKIKVPHKGDVDSIHNYISSVCVTPDNKHVVAGSDDNTIFVIRIEDGKLIRKNPNHTGAVNQVRVTPDCKYVVSLSRDIKMRVMVITRFEDGELVDRIKFQWNDGLTSICLTPDGKNVVSVSHRGIVRITRIKDGALLREIPHAHVGSIWNVCVTPDGKHVVTAGKSTIYVICITNVILCRQWVRILLRDHLPINKPALQQLLMYVHMYPGLVKFLGTKLMLFAAYV